MNYVGKTSKNGLSEYLHSARSRQNVFDRLEEDRVHRTQRVFIESDSDASSSKPKVYSKFRPGRRSKQTTRFPMTTSFVNLKLKGS